MRSSLRGTDPGATNGSRTTVPRDTLFSDALQRLHPECTLAPRNRKVALCEFRGLRIGETGFEPATARPRAGTIHAHTVRFDETRCDSRRSVLLSVAQFAPRIAPRRGALGGSRSTPCDRRDRSAARCNGQSSRPQRSSWLDPVRLADLQGVRRAVDDVDRAVGAVGAGDARRGRAGADEQVATARAVASVGLFMLGGTPGRRRRLSPWDAARLQRGGRIDGAGVALEGDAQGRTRAGRRGRRCRPRPPAAEGAGDATPSMSTQAREAPSSGSSCAVVGRRRWRRRSTSVARPATRPVALMGR
jgi:hypothetical protein